MCTFPPFDAHLLQDSVIEPADNGINFLSSPRNYTIFGKMRGQSKWTIEKVKLQLSVAFEMVHPLRSKEAPSD